MAVVMDADRVSRSLTRIAHEILERNRGARTTWRSSAFARAACRSPQRLAAELKKLTGVDVPTGALDITLYRDDLMRHAVGPQPVIRRTEIPFSIDDRLILLVDDVLYTGRTIRAALDALIDFGRPRAIQLVALVDRGHRELPIRADYVGRNIPTSRQQSVQVRLREIDGRDEVEVEGSDAMSTATALRSRHLLGIDELEPAEIDLILETALAMKEVGTRPDQESADAARPDRHQPVLRAEHAHAHVVRARRKAPERRHARHDDLRIERRRRARRSPTPRERSKRCRRT